MKNAILSTILIFNLTCVKAQQLFTRFQDLELEDCKGNIINTSTFLGKTIYVDFWFTACAPCIKEIPHSKALQHFFKKDTNIVFMTICIENIDRKPIWREMVLQQEMKGINLFYARNRPQNVNLMRAYNITFPTYILVNSKMKVIGDNAPRPSEKGWVHWAIYRAAQGVSLTQSKEEMNKNTTDFKKFIEQEHF